MKKINIKSLRVGSPRRECAKTASENGVGAGAPNPHPASLNIKTSDSPDDSGGHSHSDMSNDSFSDGMVVTPKRKAKKGILKTLRRKFTPSRKKDENIENSPSHGARTSRWHAMAYEDQCRVERCRSGSHSADRALRRRATESQTEVCDRDSSGHRQCSTTYPGSLNRPHKAKAHIRSCQAAVNRQKSEEESEKECEDVKNRALFPFDTEYGHASAPFTNGDDNENSIPHGFQSSPLGEASANCSARSQDGIQPGTSGAHESFEQYDSSGDSQQSVGIVCVPIPVYDQVKDPPKETSWSLSKELFKLSKFGWYWGPITRIEAEEKLADQPDGAFLVRDSSDERYLLSLSFRSYGRTLHTRIEHCNGVFSFYAQPECEGYSSIVDLIEHSMNDSQSGVFCYSRARTPGSPSFPVRLTKPVSRFTQVRSLQYLCRFVIRQYTRFDHIQTLPLPTSIKGWLQENQY